MPQATRERQGEMSLLEIALAVHMGTTGSADPEPSEYISILEDALKHWEPDTYNPYYRFDEAVRMLLHVTVEERRRAERERFDRHLKRASEEVESWPEWKKGVLGVPYQAPHNRSKDA